MSQSLAYRAAIEWYLDHGVDEALGDEPVNRLKMDEILSPTTAPAVDILQTRSSQPSSQPSSAPLGASEARTEAEKVVAQVSSLEELQTAIAEFDGLAIKKTATNMVFSDGNPQSKVMIVGEAPGADEDRQGKPFVGVSGQLLDRIFACIDMERTQEDPQKSIYISNILNWRPPGNRSPSPAEIEVSLPFIEKHIALIRPEILVFCGGVAAKALLARNDSVSKLRKSWHAYQPKTKGIAEDLNIPAIVTYHPAYLLRTPGQKRAVWADILTLQEKRLALKLV